jgi:hypothetical protein
MKNIVVMLAFLLSVTVVIAHAKVDPAQFTQKVTCTSSQIVTEETGATLQKSGPPLFPSPFGTKTRVDVKSTTERTAHIVFETDKLRYEVEGVPQFLLTPGDYNAKVERAYISILITTDQKKLVTFRYHILSVISLPDKVAQPEGK